MPDTPIAEAASTIFLAASLLMKSSRQQGDLPWTTAAALHDSFARLDREIAALREQLDRRAVAVQQSEPSTPPERPRPRPRLAPGEQPAQ